MALSEKRQEQNLTNRCLISHNNPNSTMAQQYRTIRNNLRYSAGANPLRTLAVTSPSEGEGKSTVAVNLAICFAQHGDTVLLVDTNLRNPTLNQVFNIKLWPGLMDGLINHVDIVDTIHETFIDRLSVLPCGGSSFKNVAELLDSEEMLAFLELMGESYKTIIFDCSSILETPDAIMLASKCTGAMLVVGSGETKQSTILEAKKRLEFANVNLLGAVLNNY